MELTADKMVDFKVSLLKLEELSKKLSELRITISVYPEQ